MLIFKFCTASNKMRTTAWTTNWSKSRQHQRESNLVTIVRRSSGSTSNDPSQMTSNHNIKEYVNNHSQAQDMCLISSALAGRRPYTRMPCSNCHSSLSTVQPRIQGSIINRHNHGRQSLHSSDVSSHRFMTRKCLARTSFVFDSFQVKSIRWMRNIKLKHRLNRAGPWTLTNTWSIYLRMNSDVSSKANPCRWLTILSRIGILNCTSKMPWEIWKSRFDTVRRNRKTTNRSIFANTVISKDYSGRNLNCNISLPMFKIWPYPLLRCSSMTRWFCSLIRTFPVESIERRSSINKNGFSTSMSTPNSVASLKFSSEAMKTTRKMHRGIKNEAVRFSASLVTQVCFLCSQQRWLRRRSVPNFLLISSSIELFLLEWLLSHSSHHIGLILYFRHSTAVSRSSPPLHHVPTIFLSILPVCRPIDCRSRAHYFLPRSPFDGRSIDLW